MHTHTATASTAAAQGATEVLMAAARGEIELTEHQLQLCHTVITKAVRQAANGTESQKASETRVD